MIELKKISSNLVAGIGSLNKIDQYLEDLKYPKSVLILTGENTYKIAGKAVYDKLNSGGYKVNIKIIDIKGSLDEVKQLTSYIKENFPHELLIAIGGGSIADMSKYISNETNSLLAIIPTTLSSDAFSTSYSVFWNGSQKQAIKTKAPNLIIGDYNVLKNQPKRFIAAGVGDMISKLTAIPDWRLAFWLAEEPYNDFAAKIAVSETKLLISRIDDISNANYIGISTLFQAEVLDGYLMEISGTTRVAAGAEHLISFALENISEKGLHGEYCGIGTIIISYLQRGYNYAKKVRKLLEKVNAPVTVDQLGLNKSQLVKAITIANKMRNWYTILSYGISEASAERLLRYTHII